MSDTTRPDALAALPQPIELVCALCLFVGESEDPRPITVMNGNLTCEPHNGYFQGGAHVQALMACKREHPEARNG